MTAKDTTSVVETETIIVRKWSSAVSRDRGDPPGEVVVARVVTTDGNAEEGELEVATDAERIAALNPLAIEAEQRARAQEGM